MLKQQLLSGVDVLDAPLSVHHEGGPLKQLNGGRSRNVVQRHQLVPTLLKTPGSQRSLSVVFTNRFMNS